MCGRYSNKASPKKLFVRYAAENRNFEFQPNKNIAPTQYAPVVLMEGDKRILKNMKWGLIPSWSKDPRIGAKCFNARAETVEEKPAFRASFRSRRCLIPADAFYEWGIVEPEHETVKRVDRGYGNEKERVKVPARRGPIRFTVQGEEIFSIAGLWSTWKPTSGEPVETFTILTTAPNELISPIHNRMPVILARNQEQVWADPAFTNPILLKGLLKAFPSELMKMEAINNSELVAREEDAVHFFE